MPRWVDEPAASVKIVGDPDWEDNEDSHFVGARSDGATRNKADYGEGGRRRGDKHKEDTSNDNKKGILASKRIVRLHR